MPENIMCKSLILNGNKCGKYSYIFIYAPMYSMAFTVLIFTKLRSHKAFLWTSPVPKFTHVIWQ